MQLVFVALVKIKFRENRTLSTRHGSKTNKTNKHKTENK
jgi:hypothetical protein